MDARFYADPETDEPHVYDHQVPGEEAADVLYGSGEDRPGKVPASLSAERVPVGTCELSMCRTPSRIASS